MKNLGLLLLIISLVLAGLLSYFVYQYMDQEIPEQEVVANVDFFVASRDLTVGTKITEEDVIVKEMPATFDQADYLTQREEIVGRYVDQTILSGEGFHRDKVLTDATSRVVGLLNPTERAVSMRINETVGVSNLIKPGDFIDLFVYLPELREGADGGEGDEVVRPELTKLVLQNIRVLAIGRQVSRTYEPAPDSPDSYNITLAATAPEIEKLFLIEQIGTIKLALRPIGDDDRLITEGAVWQDILANESTYIRDLFPEYDVISEGSIVEDADVLAPADQAVDTYVLYKVKYGDTLIELAERFYEDGDQYPLIKEANNIGDNNIIVTGEILYIPRLPSQNTPPPAGEGETDDN